MIPLSPHSLVPLSPLSESSRLRVRTYLRIPDPSTGDARQLQLQLDQSITQNPCWKLTHSYTDSADADTQFRLMLRDAELRKFDVLVFWSLDRFTGHSTYKTLDYLTTLSACNVEFRSYTEPYLDTCGIYRDIVIAILAALSQQERIRVAQKTAACPKAGPKSKRKYKSKPGTLSRMTLERKLNMDLERFHAMDQVYTTGELAMMLGISRASVLRLRHRYRDWEQGKIEVQVETQVEAQTGG